MFTDQELDLLADALDRERKSIKRKKRGHRVFLKKVKAIFGTQKAYADYQQIVSEINMLNTTLQVLTQLENRLFATPDHEKDDIPF